jgi:hypothetical protein
MRMPCHKGYLNSLSKTYALMYKTNYLYEIFKILYILIVPLALTS